MNDTEYYAVPDPHDPGTLTFWRRDKRGRVQPWPSKARYGPQLTVDDVPAHLRRVDRERWAQQWHRDVLSPWREQINDTIEADPHGCRSRFAWWCVRCGFCGRRLTDAASKTYGIGPECRRSLPVSTLRVFSKHVARVVAEQAEDANR